MTPVAPHIEAFLRENLSRHRGASQHTCDSYAYSFQLLFEFAATNSVLTKSVLLDSLADEKEG
jgi:integrase/recombinase XerD